MFSYSDGFKWDKVLNSTQGIRACMVTNWNNMVVQYVGRGDPYPGTRPLLIFIDIYLGRNLT